MRSASKKAGQWNFHSSLVAVLMVQARWKKFECKVKCILTVLLLVQLLRHVQLFATPRTAARQASLSTISWSFLTFMPIESVMLCIHLILCCPLLLLSSIWPSIGVLSKESALCDKWPKYWRFSFSISPSDEYSGLILFRMDWLDLLAV